LRLQTGGAVPTRETKWNFEVSISDARQLLSEFASVVLGVWMGWRFHYRRPVQFYVWILREMCNDAVGIGRTL
jgi:hypothetical protein